MSLRSQVTFRRSMLTRLQFRGICAGEKLGCFLNIARVVEDGRNTRLLWDYVGTGAAFGLTTTSRKVANLPLQIAAMMPNSVTQKLRIRDNFVRIGPPPEPHYSAYLTWAHLYRHEPV